MRPIDTMKTKTKAVYYCEFCKKHGLRAATVQAHEIHCTANPNRLCGLCERDCKQDPYTEEIKKIQEKHAWLLTMRGKDGAQDGILGTHCAVFEEFVRGLYNELECPPCALSIQRQSGGLSYMPYYDFKAEMDKYFERKNKEELEAEYNAMLWEGMR